MLQKPAEIPDFTAGSREKNRAPREVLTFLDFFAGGRKGEGVEDDSGAMYFLLANFINTGNNFIPARSNMYDAYYAGGMEHTELFAREFGEYLIERATGEPDKVLSTTSGCSDRVGAGNWSSTSAGENQNAGEKLDFFYLHQFTLPYADIWQNARLNATSNI